MNALTGKEWTEEELEQVWLTEPLRSLQDELLRLMNTKGCPTGWVLTQELQATSIAISQHLVALGIVGSDVIR
jgi:hypothetical protein